MKQFLILSILVVLVGTTVANAEYIATIGATRTSYDSSLDKITFTITDITTGAKVIVMEGTWMALTYPVSPDTQIYMDDSENLDWIYETNRSVREDPPLSYCSFQHSLDASGAVWDRTDDETHYTDYLIGVWYTTNENYKLGLGDTLAVMYITKDGGVWFEGQMSVSEYGVGVDTLFYSFGVLPEPGTLALLASGLLCLLALKQANIDG